MKKLLIFLILLSSCTSNQKARMVGGTETITLEPNEQFINISWQNSNLWIIVKDTTTGVYYAKEKSNFGEMEGKLIIKH